jgi:GNAT superfamily N-acetyltransferase
MFRKYHYLSENFNYAAKVIVCTANGQLCGFASALPFPHPKRKHTWREHRTVVFPDFQGVGIGGALNSFIAQTFIDEGRCYISTTSNPAMIASRIKNPAWRMTRKGRLSGGMRTAKLKGTFSTNRITSSFEYVGTKPTTQYDGTRATAHAQTQRSTHTDKPQ